MDSHLPYWGGFVLNSENLGFWVRDGIYASLSAFLMRRLEPHEVECINQGHVVCQGHCSPVSWGLGLCAHELCLSCWVTHWVGRVWALKNKRWRHFRMGEVRQLTFFEYLFAINIPIFQPLFSLSKEDAESLVGKSSWGSRVRDPSSVSMSPPIHPISEKLVSSGMVFTESVLSWTFTCYCLSNILPTTWGDGWNPHC